MTLEKNCIFEVLKQFTMNTATIQQFKNYLSSLNITPAETDETETSFMAFIDPKSSITDKKIQSRFTCVNITKKGDKMYQGLRLAKVDLLNFDITEGFFVFDTAAILAKGRQRLRSGFYGKQSRH